MRLSPWWLLVGAIAAGAALTGIGGLIDGERPSALEWLASTAGVAALVVAVGIYRLQEISANEAHAELMGQIEAQGELLNEYAKRDEGEAPTVGGVRSPGAPAKEALTADQRASVEDQFGVDSIEGAFDPGRGRGKRDRARLVRLRDGRLVSVYEDPRRGRTTVREIDPTRRGFRPRGGAR
ncbi:MAG TPA: hypothetical protein VHS74_02110 [Solirubrobacterales bacterium]|jgi:hypothetical protein|nr:hypothetical protein [Solirubrobacterales bacterium]